QLRRFGFEFRIAGMHDPEIGKRERMLLHRDEMELAAARRVAPPRLPGGEEIEAEAEAGLEDHEALATGPALGQAIAGEEDVPGLLRSAGGAVVNVAEFPRPRRGV